MLKNPNIAKLKASYLFREIAHRKQQFLESNPDAKLISLGIGDTTEPIPTSISAELERAGKKLGTTEGYSGYGHDQGNPGLRTKIASRIYEGIVNPTEIFISDGIKADLGRWQMLFGSHVSIAVQDPSYPVYIDGSVIQGVEKITFLPCLPQNNFFPDLKNIRKGDLIYFCSPNNPTGAVATRQQLQDLVEFAIVNRSIVLYDAAYSSYIQDPLLPKSIFEIPGARRVAIELGSFSKIAGFTGVRLGWSVVPEELRYEDGTSVKSDWHRLVSTVFNGASNISQAGGEAVLDDIGWKEVNAQVQYYLENARMIMAALEHHDCELYGGKHAPYIWARFPGKSSWNLFQHFLEKYHLVTTPGEGFGPSGQEFLRFTAFGHPHHVEEAIKRLLS
jgi:LL-diaminopimelate aminotransferase